MDRRDFLRSVGLGATVLLGGPLTGVAGPFNEKDFESLVPVDKKLSDSWLDSLKQRGTATAYTGKDLRFIGMPIGGLCAGQLYLGGDGKLWFWDIFNLPPDPDFASYAGPHYAKPMDAFSPIDQGFALRVVSQGQAQTKTLDRQGFSQITFEGQYPIGTVKYREPNLPVSVDLEAYSPFIPLNTRESSIPVTIMEFTVTNTGPESIDVEIGGWLENGVCLSSGKPGRGRRRNHIFRDKLGVFMHCTAMAVSQEKRTSLRADILFEGFETETYEGWTRTGTAFGDGPVEQDKMPQYQGKVGAQGKRLVNTHNARNGEDVYKADAHTGTLTSRDFIIERDYINFLIGGGGHRDKTCINLWVDGRVMLSTTGSNDNKLKPASFDVRAWSGKTARLQIVDQETGPWGNIGIDDIHFSDVPQQAIKELIAEPDYGSMGMVLLGKGSQIMALPGTQSDRMFEGQHSSLPAAQEGPFGSKLVGALGRKIKLKPGQNKKFVFAIGWHFPTLRREGFEHITGIEQLQRAYGKQFDSALSVLRYVARNYSSLTEQTHQWRRVWYDSTLPWWFLERTFLNTSILATSTCHRFDNGRFYGWEGTYCCPGTCTHVWQYAHAAGRVFPELERTTREMVDYGIAFHNDTGAMDYRAEAHRRVAIDGQAGTILRACREHQMCADDSFLKGHWSKIKKSIQYLIHEDANADGILEGEQYNTLDASWYGEIAWLSSLYLAALRAGEIMAQDAGDVAFADQCKRIADNGMRLLSERLFNGEYFIHRVDSNHKDTINTNDGCHIDQVYGQSWAFQVGVDRVVTQPECCKALESLWRYNFTPDVGHYRKHFEAIKGGRWYAMPGEGGLLMCTWPKGGAEKASGKGEAAFVAYFNECMTGFEYQVAAHMIWEGLVEKGLAITRMIHDRYHASQRNPWNEVECSNHYARAMASYGVFLAACGYKYHGPRGLIGFAPKLNAEKFRAAFIAAEGWGTFAQSRSGTGQAYTLDVAWGSLQLTTIEIEGATHTVPSRTSVKHQGRVVPHTIEQKGNQISVHLKKPIRLKAGEVLRIELV